MSKSAVGKPYTTLRAGLYDALKYSMEKSGVSLDQGTQENLKAMANIQADTIIDFITKQTFTIKEFKGAVEIVTLTNNSVDADIKQNLFIDMIGIYLMMFKILVDPLKKVVVTKPIHSAIMGILGKIEQTILSFLPAGVGSGDVSVPIELSKDDTGMVAQGYAYVGNEASSIGPDGSTIANEFGEHTKVVLHKEKVSAQEKKKLA